MSERVEGWLAGLALDEKCRMVAGATLWRTCAVERLGIPAMKVSDGPNGVRGEFGGDQQTAAVVIPSGTAQGASWDPGLLRRLGELIGRETKRRGAHVVLAPAVNLHRTPVGGRNFEYMSEDPELTAALAAAFVQGVQSEGVGVTVKHFVANDTEAERLSVDVKVEERVLRELYLRPFEACVRAGAWGVMSAYNRLNGDFCAGNHRLLTEILRDEWGFDGVVVSDWWGAHDTQASAAAGLDLEMPGPPRIFGPALERAVGAGAVPEEAVDRSVRRVLTLIERTGAVERPAGAERSVDDPEDAALCREAAVAGAVLARNRDGTLPLEGVGRLAVIGPNAARTRIMGGGSASLKPLRADSIADVLSRRVPEVRVAAGCSIDRRAPVPEPDSWSGPDGHPGLEVRWLVGGRVAHTGRLATTDIVLSSVPAEVLGGDFTIEVHGWYRPARSGVHRVGAVVSGRPRIVAGGVTVVSGTERLARGEEWNGTVSAEQVADVEMEEGVPVEFSIAWPRRGPSGILRVGVHPSLADDALAEAVAAAASADAAVVVVGTSEEWESEGHDRRGIELPGDQDDLVRAVAAACDRTVVVVNSGAPVAMPWLEEVGAVLVAWFGGMEMAEAVADVLLGEADPGGRLPQSWPVRLEDVPAWRHYLPLEGRQVYGEGMSVGYRGHDASGILPLLPFGHGLSYGEAEWGDPQLVQDSEGFWVVGVPVSCTGNRPVTVVVQGYVSATEPPVQREPKALRAWAKAVLAPGEGRELTLRFGPEAFRRWDGACWIVDAGGYELLIGASAQDIRWRLPVQVAL